MATDPAFGSYFTLRGADTTAPQRTALQSALIGLRAARRELQVLGDEATTACEGEADVELRGAFTDVVQCLRGSILRVDRSIEDLEKALVPGVDRLPEIETRVRAIAAEKRR